MGVLDFLGTTAATNVANVGMSLLQMHREDNAVQRRARDLEAAGLNPVLAAGSAASAQAPIAMRSAGGAGPGTEMATARSQAAMTQAQADLIAAQARSADADAKLKEYRYNKEVTTQDDTGVHKTIVPVTWQEMMMRKLEAEVKSAETRSDRESKEWYENKTYYNELEGEINYVLSKNKEEIAQKELELRDNGYEGQRLEKERMLFIVSLLKTEGKYKEASEIMRLIGSLLGPAASMTGSLAGWRGLNPR